MNNVAFTERITNRVNRNIGEETVVKTRTETILGTIKSIEKEGAAFYVDEKKVNIEEIEYMLIENEVIRKDL